MVMIFLYPIPWGNFLYRARKEPDTGSGLVVTERTVLHKTKKDLKSAGVIENLTTKVAENKFAAKDERF